MTIAVDLGRKANKQTICVCNILTVGVHLSSTLSIRGPGSATGFGRDNLWSEDRLGCYQSQPEYVLLYQRGCHRLSLHDL